MFLSSGIYYDDIENADPKLPLASEKISLVAHQNQTVLLRSSCPPTEANLGGQESVTPSMDSDNMCV